MAKKQRQKDKQRSTKHYKENKKIEQHKPHCHVFRNGKQFLLHMWHPSCYSCYKPGDKSSMRIWPDCEYDTQNIYVVICDTETP